jgi:hypothetical protein
VGSISAAEQEEALRAYAKLRTGMGGIGYPLAILSVTQIDDPSELVRVLRGMGPAESIGEILAQSRAQYGAELLIPWSQHDRSAQAFAEYLERCQQSALAS